MNTRVFNILIFFNNLSLNHSSISNQPFLLNGSRKTIQICLGIMLFPGGFKQTMRTLVLKRNRSTGIVLHLKRNGGLKS